MSKENYNYFLNHYAITKIVQMEQFAQWLRKFFFLNEELHKNLNPIYLNTFYLVFYQLISEGIDHLNKVIIALEKNKDSSKEKLKWYLTLRNGIIELKSKFSDNELEFIEYRRHNVCHIFQEHYVPKLKKDGTISKHRKGKNMYLQELDFMKLIRQHGSEQNYDKYFLEKLYPIICTLYEKLK